MSATIFGGKTRNNVIVQDMVDDNRDYAFRNEQFAGYFARLSMSLLKEDDPEFKTAAPSIVIFSEEEPFEPLWGVRLPGSFDDYTDGFEMSALFMKELDKLWEDFRTAGHLGQVQTERGLIYVEACFKTTEQAKEAGYAYAFSSKRLGAELYSKCLDDRGLHHAFAAVFS